MNHQHSYESRQSIDNFAELAFEEFCKKRGTIFYRFGFDEKNRNIEGFYNLNWFVRNMPDYLVEKNGEFTFVCVKGTNKIKDEEAKNIPLLMDFYTNKYTSLYYAFFFKDGSHYFIDADKVIGLWDKGLRGTYPEGKPYRAIELR